MKTISGIVVMVPTTAQCVQDTTDREVTQFTNLGLVAPHTARITG